jgi:hypothetical protein
VSADGARAIPARAHRALKNSERDADRRAPRRQNLAAGTAARRESLGADSPFLIDSDRRRPVFAPLCAKFFWGECRTVGKANRNKKSKRARCICIRVSIATDIIDACK